MRVDADSDEEGRRRDDYDSPEYDGGDHGGVVDDWVDDDAAEYSAPEDDQWDLSDNGAYWRRRFLILCGGAVALGVCAWLFPGAHAPAHPSAAASASMSALTARQSPPPGATGNAWPGPTPTARPSSTPGAAASPSASASDTVPGTAPARLAATAKAVGTAKQKAGLAYHPSAAASGSGAPSASGKASGSAGASSCAASDIVLSLFTSKPGYAGGARPTFSVYAVSTSAKACTLRYGAGSVKVVVTSQGHVVWDSAACHPRAANRVRFTLGVPQVLTVTWNRKAAGPGGCAGALPAGATGTLDAVAMWGDQSSPVASFKLTK